MFAHCISNTLCVYFPGFLAPISLFVEHKVVGGELGHNGQLCVKEAEGRKVEDNVGREIKHVIGLVDKVLGGLHVAGLDCAHAHEGTPFEFTYMSSICGRSLPKDTHWVELGLIIFNCGLSFSNLLNYSFFGFI